MKRFYIITILGLMMSAVILQGVKIYFENTKSTEGITAGELTKKLLVIQEQNTELEVKLLNLASFRNVASKAGEMGLAQTRDFVSLYDPIEVASLR